MTRRIALLLAACVVASCARDTWPEPPAVDPAEYQQAYAAWRADRQQTIASSLPIVGIWPIEEGTITVRDVEFTRKGDSLTALEKGGSPKPVGFDGIRIGTIEYSMAGAPDGRVWVMGTDTAHPAVDNPPPAETYPLDAKWRVAARFDAFDAPRPVRVPDVRGGEMAFEAVGQLVFRIGGEEGTLTAFGFPDSDELFVLFKDPTNQTTTYAGYRILSPKKVKGGEFTVLDFNLAGNPPCAFSQYTVCPTPPRENRLQMAIEAGEKRLPDAKGYVPAS